MTTKDFVQVQFQPFDRSLVKKSSFKCGNPELDDWLRTYAGQQERSNNTRTFLAVPPRSAQVVG